MISVRKRTEFAWKQKLSSLLSAVIVASSLAAAQAPAAHATAVDGAGIFTSAGETPVNPGVAAAVDPELVIQNINPDYLDGSGNLDGATVSVDGFVSGDVLQVGEDHSSAITENYDADRGILSLKGSASIADYVQALRSVTFTPQPAVKVSERLRSRWEAQYRLVKTDITMNTSTRKQFLGEMPGMLPKIGTTSDVKVISPR